MELHNHYSVCLYNRPVHLRCRPWRGQQGLWGQGSGRVWKEVQLQVSGAGVSQEYFKGKAGRFQGVGHPRWRHSSPCGEGDGGGGCEDSGHERGVGRGGEGPRWGGLVLDNLPLPFREEIHNCLLCAGKDKDGLNLSLDPRKLWQVKVYNKSFYSILIGRKIPRNPPITFFFQKFPAKTCTPSLFAGEILLRQLLLWQRCLHVPGRILSSRFSMLCFWNIEITKSQTQETRTPMRMGAPGMCWVGRSNTGVWRLLAIWKDR